MDDVNADPTFLSGGGSLGALIRAHDWAETPLGPPDGWPQSLRSALSICLHSSFPTAIYWGPSLTLLYNDAWAPIPAERHPWALGRPGSEVWSDIWHVVGPQFQRVMETGEGFSAFDQMLPMMRSGVVTETYWNYSFTAIRGEDGRVVGVFNQGNETTAAVVARRRAEAEIERLGRMFAQAPGAVAILRGPNHVVEIANPAYLELVGRTDITGKTIAEALPEVVTQGFVDLLDRVFLAGEPYVGRMVPVLLQREAGKPAERRYIDFVYQPLTDAAGVRSGIFVQATDVTDGARAELALRESEARFQGIVNSIDQMIWSTRPDGHHDYYNDRWYEYTGVPWGSTDGEAWNDMFHPEDRDRAWQVWRRCLVTGEPYHIEYRLRHRSGQYRWVIGRAQCVRDGDGEIVRWYGTCTDIHNLKMAEEELAEQARVLEILNRTGQAIAAKIDLEDAVQTVTDAGVALIGARFGAFFHNLKDEADETYTLYTLSGIQRSEFDRFAMARMTELFAPTFDGSAVVRSDDIAIDPRFGRNTPHSGLPEGHLPVRSYLAVPVISRSGTVIGGLFFGHTEARVFTEHAERLMTGIAAQAAIAIDNATLFRAAQHEIAERQRKEDALRESEEFSRSVVESSGDCIKVLDLEGRLRFMNESGRILLEIDDLATVYGRLWAEIWPEESRGDIEAALAAASAGGVGRFSAFCPTWRGTPKWWDVVLTPVPGRDGRPIRYVSISRDITEQKRFEEARQLLLRELNHRVKNLFAITSGMVTMTARTAPSVAAMAETLKGRLAALAKAHELIRSAISADMEEHQQVLLRPLVDEVTRPHVDPNGASQIEIEGPDLFIGVAAATSLALVLHEMATNAAKYGALATADGRLAIVWRMADDQLELEWKERVVLTTIGPPTTQGFGSRLARSGVTGQLGGTLTYDWQSGGVRISMRIPLRNLER